MSSTRIPSECVFQIRLAFTQNGVMCQCPFCCPQILDVSLSARGISLLTLNKQKGGRETDEHEKRFGFGERAGRWVDTNSVAVITHE